VFSLSLLECNRSKKDLMAGIWGYKFRSAKTGCAEGPTTKTPGWPKSQVPQVFTRPFWHKRLSKGSRAWPKSSPTSPWMECSATHNRCGWIACGKRELDGTASCWLLQLGLWKGTLAGPLSPGPKKPQAWAVFVCARVGISPVVVVLGKLPRRVAGLRLYTHCPIRPVGWHLGAASNLISNRRSRYAELPTVIRASRKKPSGAKGMRASKGGATGGRNHRAGPPACRPPGTVAEGRHRAGRGVQGIAARRVYTLRLETQARRFWGLQARHAAMGARASQ
jgi:hypothetical protein